MELMKSVGNKKLQTGAGEGKIRSLNEWLEILSAFKIRHGRCETNCYISLPQIEEYINEGRLTYEVIPGMTLWLFEKERDYYLGYYYVPKEKGIYIRPQDLDVMVYLIGSEKKYAEKREEELVESGCRRYRRNLEYILTSEQIPELEKMDRKCASFMTRMGYHYTFFRVKDYEVIYKLWKERIDKYSVKDMLESKIRRIEEEKECIIMRDREENIVAACVFEINGSAGFSENIATTATCNGIGIGGALLARSWLDIFSRGCNKDCIWVWEGNIESRRMTERFAVPTGRFSQQMLLERRSCM